MIIYILDQEFVEVCESDTLKLHLTDGFSEVLVATSLSSSKVQTFPLETYISLRVM